ncbi:MAG: NADH-quinone oxidoreductase, subunit [Fibrobacterota bacterium]|jgi:NADH-quinone oxidoreductase subunit N
MLPAAELFPFFLPFLALSAGIVFTLVSEPFLQPAHKHRILPVVGILSLLGAMASFALIRDSSWYGLLQVDSSRAIMGLVVLAAAILGLAGLQQKLSEEDFPGGEPYILMLLATAGALMMTQASSSLSLFIGMELASLPIYAMVGLRRREEMGIEALFKYFIMGAVFSAVFLYGASLLYGATGTLRFAAMPIAGREVYFYAGAILVSVGLLFKAGVAPFHFWSADAYAGAPTPVTGFMASVIKVGSLVALGTLWQTWVVLPLDMAERLFWIFAVGGILSVAVGAFSGLGQRRARRLMAFSSVSHAGFLLFALLPTGMVIGGLPQLSNLWYYLFTYALGTSVVLSGLSAVTGKDDEGDTLQALAGAGKANPLLGATITVSLASLAGFPLGAGFLAKFNVLATLVANGQWKIASLLLLLAMVGAVYYIRLAVVLWADSQTPRAPVVVRPLLAIALSLASALLVLGLVFPGRFGG